MKKSVLMAMTLVAFATSFAQSDVKKTPSLAIHFSLIDYKGAADLRGNSLASVIESNNLFTVKRMDPALSISYLEGFTDNIDFVATLTGAFVKHPTSDAVKNPSGNDQFLLEAAATANFKLLTDNYVVSPFLTVGVGASKWSGYFSAFVPIGVGLQVKIADGTFMMLNSQYRVAATENSAYHLYHSIGFASSIAPRKQVVVPVLLPAPPVAVVVLDKDGDGVLDKDDKCPDVAGLASLGGCPDKDSDGIADGDDKCPDVAGLAKYGGCPIPDTDKDGINDEEDKCPTKAGTAANQGCPEIAKTVIDKINYAAKNVFFASGSAKLLPKSYKALDEAAKLIKEDESLMVDVDGHTDASGKADKNQTLSEDRANGVKAYLVTKGIAESRLKATGYGATKPVADNKTAAGKAKNRRTEMAVRNF